MLMSGHVFVERKTFKISSFFFLSVISCIHVLLLKMADNN